MSGEQVVDLPIDHPSASRQATAVVFIRQPWPTSVDDDVFAVMGMFKPLLNGG